MIGNGKRFLCSCAGRRIRRILGLAAVVAITLSACGPTATQVPTPPATPEPAPPGCVHFEDLTLGTVYKVGDTFTDSGVTITVLPFQWIDGTWYFNGEATIVQEGLAGGSGLEVHLNNVNLGFDFRELTEITVAFGDYGGNLNIHIDGDDINFGHMGNMQGRILGDALASVEDYDGNIGVLKFADTLERFTFPQGGEFTFVIGGQELWIDDVCGYH